MKKRNASFTFETLSIKDKISHVTEEIRIVLPGTGVILGFQLTVPFSSAFATLSPLQLNMYIASLINVVFSVIFLIAPVALDRLTDDDLDLQMIYIFTTIMIRLSLLTLSLGISLAIFLVINMITKSVAIALGTSISILLLCQILWFGYSLYKNRKYKVNSTD